MDYAKFLNDNKTNITSGKTIHLGEWFSFFYDEKSNKFVLEEMDFFLDLENVLRSNTWEEFVETATNFLQKRRG